ncbi:DUF3798 domain-containing protein [Ruminococcaceae bacterium OttesenSCG-928-A16]|nr:DUF3798 domain-containing protein [Ruminococcaceae bacterium OttesenSCG-928-A16]
MKKVLAMVFAAIMLFSFTACRDASAGADNGDYKIGIITGTVSQGEEEFQAAQAMLNKYGADKIITATYPDKFSDEVETTIAQVLSLADQGAKAIVFVQAVPGAIAAIEKTRETHPDILFVCGVAAEPPREIAAAADVVMLVDEIGMGTTVIEQAAKQGAKTFVHYSFPRHLGYETIAARTALFKETCAAMGIEYVEATAPDPTGDAGVSGAQQFIVEDVPRKVAEYGADTAFFSTNCSMQEPLIRSALEQKAVYPQQCCPSPYHGYPAALNIATDGHEGDVQYMLDQIAAKVEEGGNTGRMSTWPLPVNMLMVQAGVEYAIEFCEGNTEGRYDEAKFRAAVDKVAAEYDASATLSYYADDEGEVDNFYMILCDFYNF